MITAIWIMPNFLCYLIAFSGIICTLYTGLNKNKYRLLGKLFTYGACLFDVVAGVVSIMTKTVIWLALLDIVELILLVIAMIIEIRSAQFMGFLFVLGRFIIGCVIGCVVVNLFAEINAILGVLGFASIAFFFSFFDSGSTYYDSDNEFDSFYANVEGEYWKVDNSYKEHFTGRNIIQMRNDTGIDYLEQKFEGSSTYCCKSDNCEYTRVGNRFIKK